MCAVAAMMVHPARPVRMIAQSVTRNPAENQRNRPYGPPRSNRGNRANSRIFRDFPESLDFWIFTGVLESGRHPRGFLDPLGSILAEYQLKPSHMDLIRTKFHDFDLNLVF